MDDDFVENAFIEYQWGGDERPKGDDDEEVSWGSWMDIVNTWALAEDSASSSSEEEEAPSLGSFVRKKQQQ